MSTNRPIALHAMHVPPRTGISGYPEPFKSRMAQREKRQLGEQFGLKNFGVNITRLMPGGMSSLMHQHRTQDEFIYVLSGTPTLATDEGEIELLPGMCAGFPALGIAHHLLNRTLADVLYLEVGDRSPNDAAVYPRDDIVATLDVAGAWRYFRKNGSSY